MKRNDSYLHSIFDDNSWFRSEKILQCNMQINVSNQCIFFLLHKQKTSDIARVSQHHIENVLSNQQYYNYDFFFKPM